MYSRAFRGQRVCERTIEALNFFRPRHLSHLRRLASLYAAYPVLPHWTTHSRAYGAAMRFTDRSARFGVRRLRAASFRRTIPNRTLQTLSARGAAERSPARKGWESRPRNSEHRRCGTWRPRIVVLTQTLKPRPTNILGNCLGFACDKMRLPRHQPL